MMISVYHYIFFLSQFQNTVCVDGWPLAIHGKLILHLSPLNESIVRTTDIYLCIKPSNNFVCENNQINLCAVWRSFNTDSVVYQILDPIKDSLTSTSLEMLTEDLPQLLQSLLVSFEQSTTRVPFDGLAFPKCNDDDEINGPSSNELSSNTANTRVAQSSVKNNEYATESSKCSIKRREIITRHKPVQNRYTLRRMPFNKNESENSETNEIQLMISKPSITTSTSAAISCNTANNMPMFCLGGSFPHIDSDEDSGDDATAKSSNDRK